MTLKRKIYWTAAVFLALIGALFVFGVLPIFSSIKKESKELLSQKEEVLELEEKVKEFKEFQILIESENSPQELVDKLFFNSKEPLDFIEFLERNAEDCQLSFEVSPGLSQKIKEDPWPSMNFQMDLVGLFPNFLKFLERLEKNLYLIEVLNLSITKIEAKEILAETLPPTAVKINLLIKAYTE
ncbi:MAG: hypothetical protein COS47_01470 [Candidatus Nealsonbacteria bacterium CG03_land_8_20_14_0_80_36_12]|uniref:Type 4a pilus biogenesis protein PilO n=1 Tax=Candidatus Nealsonbacteria bacterium CG03_land_8_20_14_0_80_36_12 TaxID=1974701 RepID=A0A2M7BY90_9BACT|nr:MAG: hypothetical protein COS47_01470 [Candidatus Nealsonbacteria bacterium CG03_land_8_20_14_0_80_36_12]